MSIMTILNGPQATPTVVPGTLMLHKDQPPMVVVVTEAPNAAGDFAGVSIEDGVYLTEWAGDQFSPYIGKLTLEQ